jgi:hypothetical protein
LNINSNVIVQIVAGGLLKEGAMPDAFLNRVRAKEFCELYGLKIPILLAPMAGACPVALSAAVANAGGMGGAPKRK